MKRGGRKKGLHAISGLVIYMLKALYTMRLFLWHVRFSVEIDHPLKIFLIKKKKKKKQSWARKTKNNKQAKKGFSNVTF